MATASQQSKPASSAADRLKRVTGIFGPDGLLNSQNVERKEAIARSSADAPEIDGVVRIVRPGKLRAGEWADVEISSADAYDLVGRVAAA